MKNTKLLLLALPFLMVTSCKPKEFSSESSEENTHIVDSWTWSETFTTHEPYFFNKNYSIAIHCYNNEEDYTKELHVGNYAVMEESYDAIEISDPHPTYYVTSEDRITFGGKRCDGIEISYSEDQEKYVSRETHLDISDLISEYLLPFHNFSAFTYDEKNNKYEVTNYSIHIQDLKIDVVYAGFLFTDGKLMEGSMIVSSDGTEKVTMNYDLTFSYGITEFEVPEYE